MNLVKQYGGRSIDTLEKIQAIAKKTAVTREPGDGLMSLFVRQIYWNRKFFFGKTVPLTAPKIFFVLYGAYKMNTLYILTTAETLFHNQER